jgi:hypothetical protein
MYLENNFYNVNHYVGYFGEFDRETRILRISIAISVDIASFLENHVYLLKDIDCSFILSSNIYCIFIALKLKSILTTYSFFSYNIWF